MFVGLLDFDSIIYKAVYRVVGIDEMREAIDAYGKDTAKEWLNELVIERGMKRCNASVEEIDMYLSNHFETPIDFYEIFVTKCSKSFRKELAPSYKSNRKRNKYVSLLRNHFMFEMDAIYDDVYEADDLIADRARALRDDCIVISIDKDLKTIGGYYWSYYKQPLKDDDGEYYLNDFGGKEQFYKQREVMYIEKDEADRLFWIQMLEGDTSDNIKGVKGIGAVGAKKIINNATSNFVSTARTYIKKNQKDDFWINYELLRLGSRELNENKLN